MSDEQPWSWAKLRGALERTVDDLREGAAQLLESWTETPAQFGERMRAAYADVYRVDGEWAHEQTVRVADRLNAARAPAEPLTPVVLWSPRYNAWTLPGRYLYLTREMQQTLPTDDAVAFVLAHEMAHHDLGHIVAEPSEREAEAEAAKLLSRIARAPSIAWLTTYMQTRWMRPEAELTADLRALELCEAAGYERERCLQAFDAMRKRVLDLGDVENAYGLDAHPDDDPDWSWLRERVRQRLTGYPSLWERKQRLLLGIAPDQTEAPTPPEPEPEPSEPAHDGEPEQPERPGRRKIPDPPTYL